MCATLNWLHDLEDVVLAGGRRRWIKRCRELSQRAPSPQLAQLVAIALELQCVDVAAVLSNDDSARILSFLRTPTRTPEDVTPAFLTSSLSSSISAFLAAYASDEEREAEGEVRLLFVAIALLQTFVSVNWTGFALAADFLLPASSPLLPALTRASNALLRLDGEDVYEQSAHPFLLCAARSLLITHASALSHTRTRPHWALRALSIHHSMLEHNSATIHADLTALLPSPLPSSASPSPSHPSSLPSLLSAKLHLTLSPLLLSYWRYDDAQRSLECAQAACGLHVEVSGVLGKRTRWQKEKKSQLVVTVSKRAVDDSKERAAEDEREEDDEGGEAKDDEEDAQYMPAAQPLQSDVLLPSLSLDSSTPSPSLSPVQRCLLLRLTSHLQSSASSSHPSTRSTLLAYLSLILAPQHRRSWAVEQTALYQQSVLEVDDHHLIDRALGQLEELTRSVRIESGSEMTRRRVRMEDVHESGWMSDWAAKLSVAARFERLGLSRSALELYEDIGWVDGIIDMNVALERRSAAEALIHDRLAAQPTPKLLCLLGDLTRDVSRYEEAWTLSAATYPRAQRSLARHYRDLQQYESSIAHSQLALAVNPYAPMDCFSVGHCALALKDYGLAVQAFSKVVAYDPEYADGWNNLAACHLHLRAWSSAQMALEQATRHSFDSWKVWENALLAALQLSDWQRAVQAVERILQLKGNAKGMDKDAVDVVDVDSVERINRALLPAAAPHAAEHWKAERWAKVLLALVDRVTTDPRLWRCVAAWREAEGERSAAVHALERAYQAALLPVPSSHPSTRARFSAWQLSEGGGAKAAEVRGDVAAYTASVWRLDEAMGVLDDLLRAYCSGGQTTERLAGRMALDALETAVTTRGSAAVKTRWEERGEDVRRWRSALDDSVGEKGTVEAFGNGPAGDVRAAGSKVGGLHSSYADLWR